MLFRSLLPAAVITLGGYFLAEGILFGWQAALLQSLTGNLLQVLGSAAAFIALAAVLDRMKIKQKFLNK